MWGKDLSAAFALGLPEMSENGKVLEKSVLFVNINATGIYVNCGLRIACCFFTKVEIISVAFKWLIIFRSAQTHRGLKSAFLTS